MKLKLIEPGWETYSGVLGSVEFLDGISTAEVSTASARSLAAIMAVTDADTNIDPGDNAKFVSAIELVANYTDLPTLAESQTHVAASAKNDAVKAPAKAKKPSKEYSREELEVIADKEGISGLRKIGDEFGVKNTSISGLITEILAVAGGNKTAEEKAGE